MKNCRHCGSQNEDRAISCSECGLDLRPSPAAELAAKLPSAIGAINTKWLWRVSLAVGIPVLLLALYLLSLGPVLRFYGAKLPNVWNRVPTAVRLVYEPADRLRLPELLGRPLRAYTQWWIGVERDKREFLKLIAWIDGSVTNGMEQAAVLGFLGEPVACFTNADTVEAHFSYFAEALTYGSVTNGFVIWFSNGVVSGKSPSTGR